MKRITLIFVALIALALPAAAIAHQGGKGNGHGQALSSPGVEAWPGPKGEGHSRKCEKKRLKLLARHAAVESCRDERGEDVRAFVQKYGPAATSSENADDPEGDESETDEPKGDDTEGDDDGEHAGKPKPRVVRSAFRHCVKLELKATKKAFKNAAQECRAERALDEDAFSAKYGTNANKRNAFGKCVSGNAKGGDEADNDGEQGGTESDAPDGGSEARTRQQGGLTPLLITCSPI